MSENQPTYAPERTPPRDEYGMFWHPDLPECGEGESIIPLLLAQGFDGAVVAGEGEFPEEAIEDGHDAYWAAMRAWTPTPPHGDGWLLVAIYDHEDGPHALFVRPWPEPMDDIERACRVLAVLHDHSSKECLRDGRTELAAVHRDAVHLAQYTLDIHRRRNVPELTDAHCEAIYQAVSMANLTRDVKTPERKRAIVRDAIGGGA